jgi:hypothetical protein
LVNEPLFNSTWKRMDESGKRAFRRHVWDQVADEPPENIEAFIRNNRNVLGRVFDPEHLKALETIQKARYRTGFTNEPEGMHYEPGLLRNIERRLGQKIPVAMSRFYAFKTGRMDPAYLMTDIIARSLQGRSRAHAEDVFKQALYDKNIAREMALTAKGVPFTVQRMARLNGWLVNLAIEDD